MSDRTGSSTYWRRRRRNQATRTCITFRLAAWFGPPAMRATRRKRALSRRPRRTPDRGASRGNTGRLAGGSRTPTLVICLACLLAIRGWTDLNPQFQLFVALDGGFFGTATFFPPHQCQLGAGFGVLLLHKPKRQHLALVEAVSGEHRSADNLATARYRIK